MEKNSNEGIQAAYALNLCTVSVSQIIDYDDIVVLEQEYDAILNNLNIQNMPPDDALLHILKQLLDTVTFFRIQEGERQLLDKTYQNKMKNAIWNAVPNLGVIVAAGNPAAIAISLASQIGTSYMNYRRAKADIAIERERDDWKLQRAAIEQFDGLRRELFDTAWRLAKRYNFDDSLRLTERQIKQYDRILMDSDVVRKYQRLEAIKDNFEAYPPFWYFLGNAANEISRNKTICTEPEESAMYTEMASIYFSRYWEKNQFNLLREDHLASACALEYADILIDAGAAANEIMGYIGKALKYSGNALDILQLCAIAYLRVDAIREAKDILTYLVNESYNTSVNAQLLSGTLINIYRSDSISASERLHLKTEYNILNSRTDQKMFLLPWPKDGESTDTLFIEDQREYIASELYEILENIKAHHVIELNSLLPFPQDGKSYDLSYFSERMRSQRLKKVRSVFSITEKKNQYLESLKETKFSTGYVDKYDQLLHILAEWPFIDIERIKLLAEKQISNNKNVIADLQSKMQQGTFSISDYEIMQSLCDFDSCSAIFDTARAEIEQKVKTIKDMKDISQIESFIEKFCDKYEFARLHDKDSNEPEKRTLDYLSYELLGANATAVIDEQTKINKMRTTAIKYIEAFEGATKVDYLTAASGKVDQYFENCKDPILKQYREECVAVLDDKGLINDFDLCLTSKGVLCVVKGKPGAIVSYEQVKDTGVDIELPVGDKSLHYGSKTLSPDQINNLIDLMRELNSIGLGKE